MADLTVRRTNGGQTQPTISRELAQPFRVMRDLLRWDPFQEMAPLWPSAFNYEAQIPQFMPAFEVKETKDGYLFKADVPGVKEQDIEVTLTGDRLTISGKRDEEKREQTDTYYSCERSYGSFTRSFTLPEGVDTNHVNAELKSGVLTVAVGKRPEVQPKRIDVKAEKPVKA